MDPNKNNRSTGNNLARILDVIRELAQRPSGSSASAVPQTDVTSRMTEDELVQYALRLSLQDSASGSTTASNVHSSWLADLRHAYDQVKIMEESYASVQRVLNSAPTEYKARCMEVSAEMRNQVAQLRQSKHKIKMILDPTVTGHSKEITRSGLMSKSFLQTGMEVATMVGMMNPTATEGHDVQESETPAADSVFNAPITVDDTIASRIEMAGEVVQDTISKQFQPTSPLSGKSQGYVPEVDDWSYSMVAARPFIAATWTWDSTMASGTEIGSVRIPQVFRNVFSSTSIGFRQYAYCSWEYIEATAHVNTNQFMAGRACLTAILSEYYDDSSSNYNRAVTSLRADVNASTMSQPKIIIPWCYNNAWMPTRDALSSAYTMRTSATVAMFVILPLMGVEGDSPSIPIRISMTVHGLRFAMPIYQMTQGDLFPAFPDPTVTGQAGDDQNDNASIVYFPRSNAFANYEPGTKAFINAIPACPPGHMTQTTEDHMLISTIVERPGIEDYITWSTHNGPGSILYQRAVTPVLPQDLPHPRTPLAYISRLAAYWNGQIRFSLDFALNAFYTGKLVAVLLPNGAEFQADNYFSFPHIVFDMKEDTKLDFEVAFVSHKPYLKIFYNTIQVNHGVKGCDLVIAVHTPLQANNSMSSTVNGVIWKSAGKDFTLYNINEPVLTAATNFTVAPLQGNAYMHPVAKVWYIKGDGLFTPAVPPDGAYSSSSPQTFHFSNGGGNWDWTGSDFYVVNGYFSNIGVVEDPQAATLDPGPQPFSITNRTITGQAGNAGALHDKTVYDIPTLGQSMSGKSAFMAELEPITSLLQVLERPHIYTTVTQLPFVNRTNQTVDFFEMFATCFAFTSGYVQYMIRGADVTIDPLGINDVGASVPTDNSFVNSGVQVPTEDGHFLLYDVPPIHANLMCMNALGSRSQLMGGGFKYLLCNAHLKYKTATPPDDLLVYVRAGPGFSYHAWCGIPTPTQQARSTVFRKKDDVPSLEVFGSSSARVSFSDKLRELREKVQKQRGPIEGQAGGDDKPKKKSKIKQVFARLHSRTSDSSSPPPGVERDVQANIGNPFESEEMEEDDEVDFDLLDLSDSSRDTPTPSRLSHSPFVPKAVYQTLDNVNSKIDSANEILRQLQGEGKSWLKDSKREITQTSASIRKTAERIERLCEMSGENLTDAKRNFFERVDSLKEGVDTNGLFNTLFGKDTNRSRLIQILLIDALECVTIRSALKWCGMLVKLGVAFGLTQQLVDLIVDYFKNRTLFGSPTERQQGTVEGQVGGATLLPLVTSLISVIVMFAAFAYTGGAHVDKKRMPTMWDWIAERARQTNAMDRGMESMFKLFEKINKWTVKLVIKFFPVEPEVFACMNEQRFLKLCDKFMTAATPLLQVEVVIKIFGDANLRQNVIDCDQLYIQILKLSSDPEVSRKHGGLIGRIERIVKELRARIISVLDNSSVRIDPFHISFYGSTELGKSYLMSSVAYVLGRSQNIPAPDVFYPRTPTMEFWDNYRCQEFVGIDDCDQQDTEELAGDMITTKSNVPKVLPMAHLETKGCMFTSRGLLSTTNVPYPEPKSIKCKEAYKRRRNLLVECIGIDNERRLDQSHMLFVYRDTRDSKKAPLSEKMTFAELCADLAVRYSEYLRVQHQLVRAVAPDTKFKPLYMYRRDDQSTYKIYQFVSEIIGRTLDPNDPYVRNIDEIHTNDDNDANYPLIDKTRGVPEDFDHTHEKKPRSRLVVEDSDVDEGDLEDSADDEPDFDPILYVEGQVGSDNATAHCSKSDPFVDCVANIDADVDENSAEEPRTYQTMMTFDEYMRECPDGPVRTFLLGAIPDEAGDTPTPASITTEFLDLIYYLTDKRYGTPKLAEEMPKVNLTPAIEQLAKENEGLYRKFIDHVRKSRTRWFDDASDKYYTDACMCYDGMNYYLVQYDETESVAAASVALTFYMYFCCRFIAVIGKIIGVNLKIGYISRMIKNLNNKILPDTFSAGATVELIRIAQEVSLTPWCILQRIAYETRSLIWAGLKYTATMIYTCITERTSPEISTLLKVGVFLVCGYLMYRGVTWLTSKSQRNEEAVHYLEGESDDNSNIALRILGREHLGLPDDGHAYSHFHQCENCRLIFQHKHARTEKTTTYRLLCKQCLRKKRAAQSDPISEPDSSDLEGEADTSFAVKFTKTKPLTGEALASSGGSPKQKFVKRTRIRGEAIASSGGTAREKFTKKLKIRGESDNIKKKFAKGVEVEKSTFWKQMFPSFYPDEQKKDVEGQASDDPQLLSVLPIIKGNCVSIHIGSRRVNMLFLCGKWAVTVAHMFEALHGEFAYCIDWKGAKFPGLLSAEWIHKAGKIPINLKKYQEDFVCVNFHNNRTLPQFRDIRDHIPSETEFDLICSSAGIIPEKLPDSGDFTHHQLPKIEPVVDTIIKTRFENEGLTATTGVVLAWTYHVDIDKGSCGSPILCRNRNLTKKLIGFHFGASGSLGYGFALFREMIDRIIPDVVVGMSSCVEDVRKYCNVTYEVFSDELPSGHNLQYVPSGRVEIVGELKPQWVTAMPRKTDIVPSPYFDKIFEHTTEPSILNDRDPRSPGDIIQRGINKFGKVNYNVRPRRIMEKIKTYKVARMEQLSKNFTGPLRTLTQDEAINGIVGQKYIAPLRMDTSPGFPFVKLRPTHEKGRKFLFIENGIKSDGSPRYEAGPLLQRFLDEIWDGLAQRKVRHNFYVDTLKDEKRSIHRLYKTRFFNVHNVAWQIVHRRLFGAVQAFRIHVGFECGSALGLDMHGPDASALMHYLAATGSKGLLEDFGEWDGNVKSEDSGDHFDIEIEFMSLHEEDEENRIRRETRVDAFTDRYHIISNVVYRVFQGVPSGDGATSDCNTGTHDILNEANWIELHLAARQPERASCESKEQECHEVCVGDDGGGFVSNRCADVYNMINRTTIFKHYGYNCTPPTKDGTNLLPWVDVDDFQFLKCHFSRDPDYKMIWHMRMAPKVIKELTNWVTVHGDPHELFYANMDDALRFSFHHGQEFFDDYRNKVNKVLREDMAPLLTMRYKQLRAEFLDQFDKMVLYSSSSESDTPGEE